MDYEHGLMPEEIELFRRFQETHRKCNPKDREVMMEEDMAPTYHEVILGMSTIGMSPWAKCRVCGKTESIACNRRLDGF